MYLVVSLVSLIAIETDPPLCCRVVVIKVLVSCLVQVNDFVPTVVSSWSVAKQLIDITLCGGTSSTAISVGFTDTSRDCTAQELCVT